MILSLIVAASLAAPPPTAMPLTAAPLPAGARATIDGMVEAAMAHQHLPAVSIAIARDGRILYARGYGLRDLGKHVAADANTVYNMASVSKQFTAAAIMLLQQDGKLSVDDTINRYFPAYAHATEITIRELLNHTSGIPDYAELPNLPHIATAQNFFDLVSKLPLEFRPGARYRYSNTNFILLGIIVEKASGKTYSEFLKRRIFAPLEMTHTSTRVVPQSQPDGAVGYTFADGRVRAAPQTPDDLGYGDGTVNSSVLDIVNWDAALDDGRVVSASSWRQMTTVPRAEGETDAYDGGYGFGLDVGTLYGHKRIAHFGQNVGYASYNATFPDDKLEIGLISNADQFYEDYLMERIFRVVVPTAGSAAALQGPVEKPAVTRRAREWLARLERGDFDKSQLTKEYAAGLTRKDATSRCVEVGAHGVPDKITYEGMAFGGHNRNYEYRLFFASAVVDYVVSLDDGGKISALTLFRED